jgi:hypothetical protein
MTSLPIWLDADVFALDDTRGELVGLGLYMLLPMVAVGLLSRLEICFRSRRAGPEPAVLSPIAESAMVGVLSYAMLVVLFMVLTADFSSIESLFFGCLFGIIISAPIIFIMVPIYIIYALRRRRNGVLPSYVVYWACLASIVIQSVFFLQLAGS